MDIGTMLERFKAFLDRWKRDYALRTTASSVLPFCITVLFAIYNVCLGIRTGSLWHISISVFYFLLAIIRGMILQTERKIAAKSEQTKARTRHKTFIVTSIMFLFLNLALALPISLMVILKKPVDMGLIPAIAMAAYTTYKLTMASIHIHKQAHYHFNNILVTELRTVNFVDALVAVLTLQNTLIMVNQEVSDPSNMLTVTAASSAAIYVVIIFTTVRLLVKGRKKGAVSD